MAIGFGSCDKETEKETEKRLKALSFKADSYTFAPGEEFVLTCEPDPVGFAAPKLVWTSSNEDVKILQTLGYSCKISTETAGAQSTITVSTEDGSISARTTVMANGEADKHLKGIHLRVVPTEEALERFSNLKQPCNIPEYTVDNQENCKDIKIILDPAMDNPGIYVEIVLEPADAEYEWPLAEEFNPWSDNNPTDGNVINTNSAEGATGLTYRSVERIRPKLEGEVIITATIGTFVADCKITVEQNEPTKVNGLSFESETVEIPLNQETVLSCTADITPLGAPVPDLVWESSNPENVEIVSSSAANCKLIGKVAESSSLITVKTEDGSVQAQCTVTVSPEGADVPLRGIYLRIIEGDSMAEYASNDDKHCNSLDIKKVDNTFVYVEVMLYPENTTYVLPSDGSGVEWVKNEAAPFNCPAGLKATGREDKKVCRVALTDLGTGVITAKVGDFSASLRVTGVEEISRGAESIDSWYVRVIPNPQTVPSILGSEQGIRTLASWTADDPDNCSTLNFTSFNAESAPLDVYLQIVTSPAHRAVLLGNPWGAVSAKNVVNTNSVEKATGCPADDRSIYRLSAVGLGTVTITAKIGEEERTITLNVTE